MYFYLYEIKKCASDFQNLIQTGDINFFVLHGVYFARYGPLKSSFSDEKTLVVESETHFSREAIENQCGKVLKNNFFIGRSWSFAELFTM